MKEVAQKKIDKYERILDAAARVFAEKGFHRARISDVAKLAGVADGTVYLYFQNKDDLLIKTFEFIMDEVNSVLNRIYENEPSHEERIKKLINAHYELASRYPHAVELITFELRQSHKFMKEYENKKFKEYLRLIATIIKEGQDAGAFSKSLSPYVASRAIFGVLNETMLQWIASKGKYQIEEISNTVMKIILDGIT
jgi:TetR/AcrR family fatty acid metabolism transcriptional regulator